jgi:hypothetical protein
MNTLNEMPSSGSFVAVWVNFGEIWSDTHKYICGELYVFDCGEWKPCEVAEFYKRKGAKFIVGDEVHG